MKDYIVVFITASSPGEGREIARALVEQRLCACVNVIDAVRSLYWWEGEVQDEGEVLLVCKSERARFPGIEQLVRKLHSYKVPEVIALPIIEGYGGYLDWISAELSSNHEEIS